MDIIQTEVIIDVCFQLRKNRVGSSRDLHRFWLSLEQRLLPHPPYIKTYLTQY